MAYHINEELGDIYYEVIGDQLILKIRDGILGRGCDIYIIKSDDATVPSDDTVFSSQRTIEEIEKRAGEGGGYWEMKEDSSGNKYIYTQYPMVSQYGATFYAGTPIEVGSIYEGLPIDNDTIYWSEVDGVKILKSKGGEGGDLNADKLWKLLGAATSEQINYAHLTNAFDAFIDVYKNSFVTIGEPEQDISVIKNFIGGISIGENKHKLYEKDGVVYFDGDLAVTGGITQYATGDREVSTIMDGVVTDNVTIKKENGKLVVIGGGGSSFDDAQMWKLLEASTTEQINRSHLTTALQGYATETWVNSNFPTKTGSGASGTWGIDITGSSADSDKLDGYHASGLLTSMSSSRYTNLSVTVGGHTETLSSMHVDYAWQLENTRTLWGQNFNGTQNVSGTLNEVGGINFSSNGAFNITDMGNIKASADSDDFYWNITKYNGGVALAVLGSSGNVGIGIANPTKKLVVNGDILIKGNILAEGGITQYSTGESSGGGGGVTVDALLWGQRFTGNNDITGILSSVGGINFSNSGAFNIDYNGNFKPTINSDNYYWNVYTYGGNSALSIKAQSGRIGINTTSPSELLHVNGTLRVNDKLIIASSGVDMSYGNNWKFIRNGWDGVKGDYITFFVPGNNSQSTYFEIRSNGTFYVNGNIVASGTVSWTSDGRAKNILQDLSIPLLSIAKSPTVRFMWNGWNKQNGDGKTHIGGIAQYTQKILPEAVVNSGGVLAMDYGVTGYIFAVQTAKHLLNYETKTDKEIRKLKKRIVYLENKLKEYGSI